MSFSKVLIPSGLLPNVNPLLEFVEKNLKENKSVVQAASKSFNFQRGLNLIQKYCSVDSRSWGELGKK